MSWRIEHADPIALLSELPDGLAQTSFLNPPRHTPIPVLLGTLVALLRVTREEGTLWVTGREHRRLSTLARCAGWVPTSKSRVPRATLLAASEHHHFNPRPAPLHLGSRHELYQPQPKGHCGKCAERALPDLAVEWCLLASTSPRACGVCGAPWRRTPAANNAPRQWRATCEHDNGRGRCIVIDPFCGTSNTGPVAVRLGRSYLGIDPDRVAATRALVEGGGS